MKIKAIYEDNVLKPLNALSLPENQRFDLLLREDSLIFLMNGESPKLKKI